VVILVKIIMGLKGSGKTKKLVELVREAVSTASGDVVVIEKDKKLTYDIPYQARLVDAGAYSIGTYEFLRGFICGIHAGNYDITHFFIDNFLKMVDDKTPAALGDFVDWLKTFSEREGVEFIISVSGEPESADERVKTCFI
jgi:Ni2+-binding GTPase involved in maturation of urease and hydrogenase